MMDAAAAQAALDRPTHSGRGRILIGSCIGSFFNISSVIIYSFGVFAVGIAGELGISKLEATRLIGPALLLTIVAQPFMGWIIDRWPRRNVALASLALLAAGAGLIGIAPGTPAALAIILGIAILVSCLAGPAVYGAYLSQVFDERRGLAMGIAAAFTGLGIAAIPPVANWLMQAFGWRAAYEILAGAIIIALFVNMLLFPPTRQPPGARQPSRTAEVLGTLMRRPIFWVLALLFFLTPFTANAMPLYLPLILGERGASADLAAAGLTVLGITMIISRPIFGFLMDRWPAWLVFVCVLLGPLVGTAALLFTTGIAAAFIAGIGYGVGIGGEFVAFGYIVSRTFGVRNFGVVYSWLAVAVACGVAGGPIAVGALSTDNDFSPALKAIVLASILALALTPLLRDIHRHHDPA